MSVQCKNCGNGLKIGTNIKCLAWKNGNFVNGNKQRNCSRYIDYKKYMEIVRCK